MGYADETSRDPAMLIHHLLEESAARYPDKIAVICDDVRETYAGLNAQSNRLAGWLIGQGVLPGDRVAILLENSLEYVVSYYGVLKAGGVAAPLGGDLKSDGLLRLLHKLDGKALITSARFETLVQSVVPDATSLTSLLLVRPTRSWSGLSPAAHAWHDAVGSGTIGSSTANPALSLDEGSIGSIIFTSGSTGQPKGVMLSHRNVVTNTSSICSYLELSSTDRQMVVLPFHYVMGKSLLNTHVAVGGSVVINNRFAFPADVLQQMVQEDVTGFSGVPSTYAYLLHRSPLRSYRDRLDSLRYCSQAGGHLAWQIKEELLGALPTHTRFFVMYGATEAAARLSYVEPERLREKRDSIGIPIQGVLMRVVDEQGQELPVGEVGELVAEGANIMPGYWRDAEATAVALDACGYHTGDLGYRDEDGYFFVIGRKDNQLKVGGHRLNPQEIEDALIETGLLMEVAVLGLPDPLLGQRLAALAVPAGDDVVAAEILRRCAERLPRHKLPGQIMLVRGLPKNTNGKVDRGRCRELLEKTLGE